MFKNRLNELSHVIQGCLVTLERKNITVDEGLRTIHFLLTQMQHVNGKAYAIGNGGSESIATHFCTDLLRTLKIPALALSDASILTCFANDHGYENAFSEPLNRLFQAEDLLIAISSSGKSPNMVQAAETVRKKKGILITLTGFSPSNPLRQLGDLNFWIDSSDYGLVEVGHMFLLHTLIDTWDVCSKKLKALTKSDKL